MADAWQVGQTRSFRRLPAHRWTFHISKAFGLTLHKADLIVAAFTRCATRSARYSHQPPVLP